MLVVDVRHARFKGRIYYYGTLFGDQEVFQSSRSARSGWEGVGKRENIVVVRRVCRGVRGVFMLSLLFLFSSCAQ